MVKRIFGSQRCVLVSVSTVVDAIAEMTREPRPDLFISDWRLENETARKAIEFAKDLAIPVLLFSGTPPADINVDLVVEKPCARADHELLAGAEKLVVRN